MTFSPVDVLIIGCGMYVCGRGTNGDGTVLPAVVQAHSEGLVGRVLVAGSPRYLATVAFGTTRRNLPGHWTGKERFSL